MTDDRELITSYNECALHTVSCTTVTLMLAYFNLRKGVRRLLKEESDLDGIRNRHLNASMTHVRKYVQLLRK